MSAKDQRESQDQAQEELIEHVRLLAAANRAAFQRRQQAEPRFQRLQDWR